MHITILLGKMLALFLQTNTFKLVTLGKKIDKIIVVS